MKTEELMKSLKCVKMPDEMKKKMAEKFTHDAVEKSDIENDIKEYVITADKKHGLSVVKFALPAVCVFLLIFGAVKIISLSSDNDMVKNETELRKDADKKAVEQISTTEEKEAKTSVMTTEPASVTEQSSASAVSSVKETDNENHSTKNTVNVTSKESDQAYHVTTEAERISNQKTPEISAPFSDSNNDQQSEQQYSSESVQSQLTGVPVHDPVSKRTVIRMLNSLTYYDYTCDGIPEYVINDQDGYTFYLNLSSRWVWKSDGSGNEEAELTDFAIGMIEEYKNAYGLTEFEWITYK